MGQETLILPLAALLPARRNASFGAGSLHVYSDVECLASPVGADSRALAGQSAIANASMSG
jgi:hypothetical protein